VHVLVIQINVNYFNKLKIITIIIIIIIFVVFVLCLSCLLSFVICVCMLRSFWYWPRGCWLSTLMNKKWIEWKWTELSH